MDPDCAICSKPALAQCDCEAHGLDLAVRQAEQRMMTSIYEDIRTWARVHAQDYILSYFDLLKTRRKENHGRLIHEIHERAAYYYRARPHPNEIAAADQEFKRGVDEDWKASVQRYPEVLEYFYGLVTLKIPRDDDPGVRNPPLSAMGGVALGMERERKVQVRESSEVEERRRRRKSSKGFEERPRTRDRGERELVRGDRYVREIIEVPVAPPQRARSTAGIGMGMYPPPPPGYGYVPGVPAPY